MNEAEIRKKVENLLHMNMVEGYSKTAKVSYHYTKPSADAYPFQFFWDTCFHVFILASLGETDMAKKHVLSLFALQENDGFVGHMIFWNNVFPKRFTDIFQSKPGLKLRLFRTHMSSLIQPPLIAQAVQRIYSVSDDIDFLRHMIPKLKKYYDWIAESRDFDRTGLISIISPFESGFDWKPSYDEVVGFKEGKANRRLFQKMISVDIRNFFNNYNSQNIYHRNYFIVKDAGFNTIYIQNLRALADLCDTVHDPAGESFRRRANHAFQSLLKIMYDDDGAAFYDVYGKKNEKSRVLTPTLFFPLVLKDMPNEISDQVIERHFFNKEEFHLPFPIPSVAKNHPSFNPDESLFIWRGPTRIVYNWFMHKFFLDKEYREEAQKLAKSVKMLIEKSGFREYYDPFTGKGHGAKNFTWSGLLIDMLEMEKSYRVENI